VIQTFRPGSRFGGRSDERFEVERKVGQGAQGLVILARDHRLNRQVAIKVCTAPSGVGRQQFLRRFDRELQLTSRVNHPHIVSIHDCDETKDGCPYVVLEWMERGALDGFAHRTRKEGLHTPLPWIGYYASAISAGLRAVHSRQIVHRDIKPDNILVNADGVAKITDFGIAKDVSDEAMPLTEMGMALGTLGFMAPEQLRGLPISQSDIFSLGVTLYALVTGKVLPQQKKEHIPLGIPLEAAWDGLPRDLTAFLKRLTAPRTEDRAANIDEVLELIRGVDWSQELGVELPAEDLPPLPSGAFVSGATSMFGSVADEGVLTSETLPLNRSEGDLIPSEESMTGAPEEFPGETRSQGPEKNVEGALPSVTRVQIRSKSDIKAPILGTRELDGLDFDEDDEEPEAAFDRLALPSKRMLFGVSGLAAVGLLLFMLFSASVGPVEPGQFPAKIEQLEGYAASGSWQEATDLLSELPKAATDLPGGQLLEATDRLLAGDRSLSTDLGPGLLEQEGVLGAQTRILVAASLRLKSPTSYPAAIEAYRAVLSCSAPVCAPLRSRAQRGLRESCFVAGPTLAVCSEHLSAFPERTTRLAASLVLEGDGHSISAHEQLATLLPQLLSGDPATCNEITALRSLVARDNLTPLTRGLVGTAALRGARTPGDCSLFDGTAPR